MDKDKNRDKDNNVKSKFQELREKYTNSSIKSSFPTMATDYDKEDIDRKIKNIEKELEIELALSVKLDNNVEERIQEANLFMENNNEYIENQLSKLSDLENQLYSVMEENNKRKELDIEYNQLIKSKKYVDLGLKMRKIKDKIQRINSFLLKETQRQPED